MLEMYRLLTGFIETNPNAVWHHEVDQYGPPCPNCHKPLRTSEARFCAACGFGQEAVKTDSLPLTQYHPELF
jgi:predicted amidophosphoribosyltransferase